MDYTNSEIAELIDEHIHKKLYRDILKGRFIDGLRFCDLAEMYDRSDKQIGRIVRKYGDQVLLILEEKKRCPKKD